MDIKQQMKNKYWWLSIVSTLIMLFQLFGIVVPLKYQEAINMILGLLVTLGILNNNNTEGLGK